VRCRNTGAGNHAPQFGARADASERVRRDALRMLGAAQIEQLTAAQFAFAERNRAVPAVRSAQDPRMVFMYRDEAHRTSRWLVDDAGIVIDVASFRHRLPLG
jgi:hypothetical protein